MKEFTIASAYCWSVENVDEKTKDAYKGAKKSFRIPNSELAIKHLASMIKIGLTVKQKIILSTILIIVG